MPRRTRLPLRPRPLLDRPAALAVAREIAADQEGALSRRQLSRAGVPRWVIRAEIAAGRWQSTGRQSVVVHNGPLSWRTRCWIGVLEVGQRAALDGVTALRWAGVDALTDEEVHVIVPKGSTPWRQAEVELHESRLYREQDVVTAGIRRVRPAVAGVHAALWAVTDRQATYFLILIVQKRLASVAELAAVVGRLRRHRRRLMLRGVVAELAGGVRALSELDVARDMRRRGLPEPQRQVIRRRPSGTEYLDCELTDYQVTLEIDGVGHEEPWQRLSDLVRDITLLTEGKATVRIPVAVYVLDRERVLDALEELLVARGWRSNAA
jgi:very-short-patch-repair endonuclease